jgi:RNA polymerase sigma-70 factor (ECF subfamily)
MDVLAPDVVLVADGGGLVPAARKPIHGVDKLVTFILFGLRSAVVTGAPVWLNGAPGARLEVNGALAAAVSLTVENGRITRIYAINNPHKLARLDTEAALTR